MKADIGFLIIDVGGVGYKVFTPVGFLEKAEGGQEISLWTHLVVRETVLDLYGFETEEELEFFELLMGISGIGPKSALGILNVASTKTLKQAIQSGNTSHLTKVSGIGKKSAQKIVLELKDKLGDSDDIYVPQIQEEVDAVEALQSLGYSAHQSRDVLKNVPENISGTSERIKWALKKLGEKK